LVAAKRSGSNLRGHAGVFQPRIRSHEVNLIDVDSLCARESGFQLQRKLGGFGFAGGKSAHESANLIFRDRSEKLYAGQTRRRKQLRKLLFSG
jgi:hypothetical protein